MYAPKAQIALLIALVGSCSQVLSASTLPPRFKSTFVPAIEIENSETCCFTEALGLGPGDTVLGQVHARGFSWRAAEDPLLLSEDSAGFEPMFMNESGWIAGENNVCPDSNGGCERQIFFVSPEGQVSHYVLPGEGILRPVALSENNVLVFDGYDDSYLVEPYEEPELLQLPKGAWLPSVFGITPDGSVIGGSASLNGAGVPLRWVNREVEILEVPEGYTFGAFGPPFGVGPDGSIVSRVYQPDTGLLAAVRWNAAGEVALLPKPEGAGSCIAEYTDEDTVVGVTAIGESLYAIIWYLENDEVTGYELAEIGPDSEFSFGSIVRAGDLFAIPVMSTTKWVQSVFLFPRTAGGPALPCEEFVVMGELDIDGSAGRVPWTAFTNGSSGSMVVNVGHWQMESFLFERLRPGDVDGNDVVDGADLTLILGAWASDDRAADLNLDGIVDGADLTIALGDWG